MSTGKHCMKKRLTLNTVAVSHRSFPPLSQRCALRGGGRSQRGGATIVTSVRGNRTLEKPSFHKAAAEGNFFLRGFNHLLIFKKERGAPKKPT